MSFVDHTLDAGLDGVSVLGLGVTKTAALTLDVGAGHIVTHADGVTHELATPQSHTFTAHGTVPTLCMLALVTDGTVVDVWVDAFADTGAMAASAPPAGFSVIRCLAWFTLAAGETDLVNTTINRRVYV